MHPTRNEIAENSRKGIVALLNARLADLIALQRALKHAHWNVKGAETGQPRYLWLPGMTGRSRQLDGSLLLLEAHLRRA